MKNTHRPHRTILFGVVLLTVLAFYYGLLAYFDRTIFSPRPGRVVESMDGFQYSLISFEAGISNDELWLALRYYISLPLLEMDRLSYGSFFQGTYLLLYSLPIVMWKQRNTNFNYLQILVMLIPVFINFRLAICIYATVYLCIFALDKTASKFLFIWYAVSLVLSSSTMFVFLLFLPILGWRNLSQNSLIYKILIVTIYIVITTEFYGKISKLFDRSISGEVLSTAADAGLGYAGSFSGFAWALFSGNPFFTALTYGQYDRLIVLVPSALFGVAFAAYLARIKNHRALVFLLILMSSMLTEGVGSYSLPIVILLMLLRRKELIFGPIEELGLAYQRN